MLSKDNFKGVLLVSLGASSYGVLVTIVKYAHGMGIAIETLTIGQYIIGIIGMIIAYPIFSKKRSFRSLKLNRNTGKLILWGTSLGFTTIFYYLSARYLPVIIAIVLLMQSVWIGVVLESLRKKQFPPINQIIAVFIILAGTILATEAWGGDFRQIELPGIIYGLLAGISFAMTIYANAHVSKNLPSITRSFYLLIGGFLLVLFFYGNYITAMSFASLKYAVILGILGAVVPPITFAYGMPQLGAGIGAILSSLELPVSIISAYLILNESLSGVQIFGCITILSAIVLINIYRTASES